MIQIKIVGMQNQFVINDESKDRIIESELFKIFYPYVNKIDNVTLNDIYIWTNGYNSQVCLFGKKGEPVYYRAQTIVDTYHRIISLIRENIVIKKEYCYLHGACVEILGHTCLLLAESGTGKSVLSVYLAEKGFTVLTDDISIIEMETYRVFPISQCAHLREGGMALFSDNLQELHFNNMISRYEYPLSNKRFTNFFYVDKIFILHRMCSNIQYSWSQIPKLLLLDHMLLPYQITNNVSNAEKLSKGISINNIYYGDLEHAFGTIKEKLH